jgi:hypothetical protein
MARKLNDIFNECYERMRRGESLKGCLMRYPEHAAELEHLLRTAFDIGRRASYVQPRPEFKYWASSRLEGIRHYARQQRQPQKPGFFSWQRSWAVALTAILIIVLSGAGTAVASSDALPDEPLYPVKLATEEVRLTFAISDASKVELQAQLAETRAMEIEVMTNEGKTEQVVATAERLAKQLAAASDTISRMEGTEVTAQPSMVAPEATAPTPVPPPTTEPVPPTTEAGPALRPTWVPPSSENTTQVKASVEKTERFKKSLEGSTSRSLTALENALEQAPPQAKPALQQAIKIISERGHKKPKQEPGTQTEETEDKHKDKAKPTPFHNEQNQPSSSSDNNTGNGMKTTVGPEQVQFSLQRENEAEAEARPAPVNHTQSHHSSQEPENTIHKTSPPLNSH